MKFEELLKSEGWILFAKKLEIMGALVLLIGLIIYFIKDIGNAFLATGFISLAIVYFFDGFKESKSSILIPSSFFRIYGWGLAISSVSLLFTLMKWPISTYSLIISMVIVLIYILMGLKFRKNDDRNFINNYYLMV